MTSDKLDKYCDKKPLVYLHQSMNMFTPLEWRWDDLVISTHPERMDIDSIEDMLSRAYWAQGRTREQLEIALANSLVFSLFDGERQIGLARVVTDGAVFAYLCDVLVHEEFRGRGLGQWLMGVVMGHPELQGLRRWTLVTRDAHGLYSRFGFTPLVKPDFWMEVYNRVPEDFSHTPFPEQPCKDS